MGSSSSRPPSAAVVRLKMYSPAILLIGAILLPPTQPLPAEGWETYAFNPKLLIKDLPNLIAKDIKDKKDRATDCSLMLCIKDSSPTNSTYPWLINNPKARFAYVRTDSEGKASYTFTRTGNGQNKNYYLHYYIIKYMCMLILSVCVCVSVCLCVCLCV